jgi:hypothetical protein
MDKRSIAPCGHDQPDLGMAATLHAYRRMCSRKISQEAIDAVLDYGREIHTRGAVVYAIGRREIAHLACWGIDLSRHDGIQVVCSDDGAILTVYRNRNFRYLRSGLGRGRHNRLGRSRAVPA